MYVVPAVTATGLANVTACQPELDSFENVACASRVPVSDQRLPTWRPVLPAPL